MNSYRSGSFGPVSGRPLRVCNAGEVSFSKQQRLPARPIEIGAVDRAAEVGNEHSTALQVQSQADAFHQMCEKDLRLLAIFGLSIHRCAVHRVATRRVSAVGPIQRPMNWIEVQIDRLRKIVIKKLNVPAALGRLTLRNLDVGPKNSAQTRVVTTLLRPIELAAFTVHRNAYTPFRRIRSRSRIAEAGIHESFDFRPVQVCPHHPHAFPVRPVKFAAPLFQMELLRCECAARRNDGDHVLAIEIRPHDRAIIPLGITHIGPVDVPSGDIEYQAVGQLTAFVDDGLQIGAIRVCGQYAAAAEVQKEEPAGRGYVFRLGVYGCGSYRAHVTNLLANVSMWSRQGIKPSTCAHRSPTPIWN